MTGVQTCALPIFPALDVDAGESGDLTSYCGFSVTVTYTGESRVTLVSDKSGLVVREIDSGTVR